MPLFTVTMKANRSAKEKDRLSRTIHAASVVTGYPEDDFETCTPTKTISNLRLKSDAIKYLPTRCFLADTYSCSR